MLDDQNTTGYGMAAGSYVVEVRYENLMPPELFYTLEHLKQLGFDGEDEAPAPFPPTMVTAAFKDTTPRESVRTLRMRTLGRVGSIVTLGTYRLSVLRAERLWGEVIWN